MFEGVQKKKRCLNDPLAAVKLHGFLCWERERNSSGSLDVALCTDPICRNVSNVYAI